MAARGAAWRSTSSRSPTRRPPRRRRRRHRRTAATKAAAPAPAPAADDGGDGGGEAAREARAQEASLLALFADCAEAPFGIHQIVLEGAAQGTPAGRWLGPTSIAQVLGRLNARAVAAPSPAPIEAGASDAAAAPAPALLLELSVHVAMDGSVYRSEVEAAAGTGDGGGWRPLLLLVPLRLGLDRLNEEYVPSLRALLGMPQSVGMIGGRPRRSHYFLGRQGERVLYLDPHEVQPALRADAPPLPSCHFAQPPRTMPMREIDPSLALIPLPHRRRLRRPVRALRRRLRRVAPRLLDRHRAARLLEALRRRGGGRGRRRRRRRRAVTVSDRYIAELCVLIERLA